MARRTTRRYFTVTGNSAFPYDMLRYDQCWPLRESETPAMSDNAHLGERGLRSIVMATDSPHAPTLGRWQSFGWAASKVHTEQDGSY